MDTIKDLKRAFFVPWLWREQQRNIYKELTRPRLPELTTPVQAVSVIRSGLRATVETPQESLLNIARQATMPRISLPEESREFVAAVRAYEEGDPVPLLELANKWFNAGIGRRLDARERAVLARELPWIGTKLYSGQFFVLLDHPERWLERGAEIRRVEAIRSKFRATFGTYQKDLEVLAAYYGETPSRVLKLEFVDALSQKGARLLSDEDLRREIGNYIRREANAKRKERANKRSPFTARRPPGTHG